MAQVDVRDAETQLIDLLRRSERGEEIIIARAGRPVARLVPLVQTPARRFGVMHLAVPTDFDEPLPESELAAWE